MSPTEATMTWCCKAPWPPAAAIHDLVDAVCCPARRQGGQAPALVWKWAGFLDVISSMRCREVPKNELTGADPTGRSSTPNAE